MLTSHLWMKGKQKGRQVSEQYVKEAFLATAHTLLLPNRRHSGWAMAAIANKRL